MTDDNPHHGKCSDSIPDIQILILSDFEIIHIGLQVETRKPLGFPFLFNTSHSGNKDQNCNGDENEDSEVWNPTELEVIVLGVRIYAEDLDGKACCLEKTVYWLSYLLIWASSG